MRFATFLPVFFFALFTLAAVPATAEPFRGEVMAASGETAKSKGDAVNAGDSLRTGAGGSVDVGFDRDWKNACRVGENSQLDVTRVYPFELELVKGEVLARVEALPKDSTFEVKTPTSIIGVRGTAFRVTTDGQTTVAQSFDNVVTAFSREGGALDGPPVTVGRFEQAVIRAGERPSVSPMSADDIRALTEAFGTFDASIAARRAEGPSATLEDAAAIAQAYAAGLAARVGAGSNTSGTSGAPAASAAPRAPHDDVRAGSPSTGSAGGGSGGDDGLDFGEYPV